MSRPYRIKLKQSVTKTVSDSDKVTQKITLDTVLSQPEMRDILKEELKKAGFKETNGKLVKKRETGEVQTVDLETLEVVTEVEIERSIKVDREVTVKSKQDSEHMSKNQKDKFKKKAKADLLAKIEAEATTAARKQQAALARLVADTLAASEKERNLELSRAVKDTYKEAIKKKAASMGNVVSVEERGTGSSDYEMVIRITE